MHPDYFLIGIVGVVNLSLLIFVIMYKTVLFIRASTFNTWKVKRQLFFYGFLLMAVVLDVPMYVSFILIGGFGQITYSFHKLESACLLVAYSMVINDWSSVLYDIQDTGGGHHSSGNMGTSTVPFVFTQAGLIFINLAYSTVSIVSFIMVYLSSDLDTFVHSPVYLACIFIQVVCVCV